MTSQIRYGKNQISLARALSKFGIASRAESARMIEAGRVSVAGNLVRDPGRWVDPRTDRISLDGKPLRQQLPVYLAMNKPEGCVTTRSDERGRRTVYDLLPADAQWVFPVGRLDKDTSGLLLLTNDTRFGERVTNPLERIPKTYHVETTEPLDHQAVHMLRSGVRLDDGSRCLPARIRFDGESRTTFDLTVTEGMNRQVRRMCIAVGTTVLRLRRLRIGSIELGDLKEGTVRPLRPEEISSLTRK